MLKYGRRSRVELYIFVFLRNSSVNSKGRNSRLRSKNDVGATAFRAKHGGNFELEHAHFNRRGDALHLNESRPLPAQFEIRAEKYTTPP